MPSREIKEWLSEFKSLKKEEFNTYAATLRQREDWVSAIASLLDSDLTNEYVEPVCHQLFKFFNLGEAELRRFTLDQVPTLIYTYLSAVSRGDKRKCSGLEACLLGIYNLDVVSSSDGKTRTKTFTIPTLAVPSIYHEPPSLATLALTESALMRYHSDSPEIVTEGPYPQLETMNAENRMTVMRYVLAMYNAEIKHMQPRSHYMLCKVAARLAKQGFDNLDDIGIAMVTIDLNDSMSSTSSRSSRRSVRFNSTSDARISLESTFLVEMLHGLYYTMFNGQPHLSIEAVNFIHKRASYEIFSDVILVTNAIRNSLQVNPSGQPQDGPMGISVALSAQRDERLSKRAITNASFRGKKLPEDIDVLYLGEDVTEDSAGHMTRDPSAPDTSDPNKVTVKKQANRKDKVPLFKKKTSSKKDIEVVNGEDHPDPPPTYDDLMESDRGSVKEEKSAGSKLTTKLPHLNNPLKSIMRKTGGSGSEKHEKTDKQAASSSSTTSTTSKVHRKESDSSRRSRHERNDSTSDTNSPKSPKSTSFVGNNSPAGFHLNNSLSSSAGTSLFSNGGETIDPTSVQVHIYEGSSGKRTVVDQLDMGSISSQASSTYTDKSHDHHVTSEQQLHNGGGNSCHGNLDVKVNPYLEDLAENDMEENSELSEQEREFMNTQL